MAFVTAHPLLPPSLSIQVRAPTSLVCCQSGGSSSEAPLSVSRRRLLTNTALTAAAAITSAFFPSSAKAEGFEQAFSKLLFPKVGFNVPDTVSPSRDLVDSEALSKPAAKAALAKLQDWSGTISSLYSTFKDDPQIELSSPLRKLSISDLRTALNVVNEAIDESTQVETDKVVRGIIQDIGELQTAALLKPGVPRTAKKIERTTDWFIKLTGDFKRLLSFYV